MRITTRARMLPFPKHPKRLFVYNKFHELLEQSLAFTDPQKTALNIEISLFNYALNVYFHGPTPLGTPCKPYWNDLFETVYLFRANVIYSNLNPESVVKNTTLITRLAAGEFTEAELASLTPEELFPERYQELTKQFNLDTAPPDPCAQNIDELPDGFFKCPRCRSVKTSYYQLQTRSADEPMTNFIKCAKCSHQWKS